MNEVMRFRGEYAFLSNLHPAAFEWDGRAYRNSEAAYQSAKSMDPAVRDGFSKMAGVTAKRAGKRVQLRADWESVKVEIMEEIVRAKFTQNPTLAEKLIATGDTELKEGNSWHDTFWGVDVTTGRGENMLGQILMKLRSELGGSDYLVAAAEQRIEKKRLARESRLAIEAEIDSLTRELDALPECDFPGKTFETRAFGRVVITRREGNYLFFEAGGRERRFSLPACIAQGFLIPEDAEIIHAYRERQALTARLTELQRLLEKL